MNADTSGELLRQLAAHAKTLGWQIVEWDWRDEHSGVTTYDLWVQPLDDATEGQQ